MDFVVKLIVLHDDHFLYPHLKLQFFYHRSELKIQQKLGSIIVKNVIFDSVKQFVINSDYFNLTVLIPNTIWGL